MENKELNVMQFKKLDVMKFDKPLEIASFMKKKQKEEDNTDLLICCMMGILFVFLVGVEIGKLL